jgi:hypothetical protein
VEVGVAHTAGEDSQDGLVGTPRRRNILLYQLERLVESAENDCAHMHHLASESRTAAGYIGPSLRLLVEDTKIESRYVRTLNPAGDPVATGEPGRTDTDSW